MTGYERAVATLNYQETDRVPILGGFLGHEEVIAEASGMNVWEAFKRAESRPPSAAPR